MSKKDELIQKLQADVDFLNQENDELNDQVIQLIQENSALRRVHPTNQTPTTGLIQKIKDVRKREPRYAADISLDVLPVRDWFRFSWSPYSLGKYAQLCIGPLRLEFFRT